MTEDKFEALINGQKIPRGRLAEMFDELTETCYEKSKHYRKFEGEESALEWEEMEELLRLNAPWDLVTADAAGAAIAKRLGISELKLRRFEKRLVAAQQSGPPPSEPARAVVWLIFG
jgi:hypothetical protein